jgi:flagellar basal-body rod modification protein FlgD
MKIDATTPAATGSSSGPGLQGTQDEFLRLFMAQLQHQDPFAPTSGSDMVAQLAQLSSVEQAKQTNARLAELTAQQSSAASAGLASLVGRECTAAGGPFELAGDGAPPPPLELTTTGPTRGAAVAIVDGAGKEVRRIPIPDGSTTATIAWDGKGASGAPLPAGSYQVVVDPGTSPAAIAPTWRAHVSAVELTAAGARLRFGGVLIAPGEVRTIGQAPAAATGPASAAAGLARSGYAAALPAIP